MLLHWTADGKHLITGAEGNPIKIWNAETGELSRETAFVANRCCMPSPMGDRIGIREEIFDVASEDRLFGFSGAPLVWSPNDRYIIHDNYWYVPGQISLRGQAIANSMNGEHCAGFGRHNDWVGPEKTDCSPDSRYCATGDSKGVVWIWTLPTAEPRAALLAIPEGTIAINPEGHYRGSEGMERHLRYVALTDSGEQLTLTPADFAEHYGWKNHPAQVTPQAENDAD